jgi:hypothetical protein
LNPDWPLSRLGCLDIRMSDEKFERKVTTPAEREARKFFRQVEAEKAMTDHDRSEKAIMTTARD